MLAIGRGLMAEPKILIIDELSLGLAPLIVRDLAQKLLEICRSEKTAVLLVEQNALLALNISNYAYIVEDGCIALEGQSENLMNDNLFKAYLGEDEH
jgi:branched-chain amino acid transport system ATP-binding protein